MPPSMKLTMLTTALLLPSIASAQRSTAPEDKVPFDDRGTADRPISLQVRAGFAVPANGNGDVQTYGLGLGTEFKSHHALALRAIYIPDPPDSPFGGVATETGIAWGPVVDWQYHFSPEYNLHFYTNVSLGYIYAVPKDDAQGNNLILPIIEGGFGARVTRKLANGQRVFIAPELGFVPGAAAPYFAVNLGLVLPEKG